MKVANRTLVQLRHDLQQFFEPEVADSMAHRLQREGIADTNELPFWRWQELKQLAAQDAAPLSPKTSNSAGIG